jgi:hypothetical protein
MPALQEMLGRVIDPFLAEYHVRAAFFYMVGHRAIIDALIDECLDRSGVES